MFRVIDDLGYEYRANSANVFDSKETFSNEHVLPFNDINGNNLSDIVGISFEVVNGGSDTVNASPLVSNTFGSPFDEVSIWDEFENPQSCSPVTFACAPGSFIYGIDNSLPPSQGGNRICNASTLSANTAGWLELPWDRRTCDTDADPNLRGNCGQSKFVGFIGLNNGDGTGSMDSWFQEEGGQSQGPPSNPG